jgi:hypothetical protein
MRERMPPRGRIAIGRDGLSDLRAIRLRHRSIREQEQDSEPGEKLGHVNGPFHSRFP